MDDERGGTAPDRWCRFGAVDVHYPQTGGACAALVVARDRRFTTIVEEHVAWLTEALPYQPGMFFARELPAVRAVLCRAGHLDLLIVDGYVDLDPEGRPGLGAYVHQDGGASAVVGVAKSHFHAATHAVPVHRGQSGRALYVTAAGMQPDRAADLVAGMSGTYRIPDALRRVDTLARTCRRATPPEADQPPEAGTLTGAAGHPGA